MSSFVLSQNRFTDRVLGRVMVKVDEVASAGRVRRSYPLQGAMMGQLELVLHWISADVAE
jgi:hypothetical protein